MCRWIVICHIYRNIDNFTHAFTENAIFILQVLYLSRYLYKDCINVLKTTKVGTSQTSKVWKKVTILLLCSLIMLHGRYSIMGVKKRVNFQGCKNV